MVKIFVRRLMLALVISLKNVVLCLKLTVLEQVRYLATLKGMDTKEIKEKLPSMDGKTGSQGKTDGQD